MGSTSEYRRDYVVMFQTEELQGKIVLSYGDCLLHESDLQLLARGGWINDKIIGFAFE